MPRTAVTSGRGPGAGGAHPVTSSIFSGRVPASLAANRLTAALARVRAAGRPLIDLTVTNPTAVGLMPSSSALESLAAPGALHYRPDAFGLLAAREAIAARIAARGGRAPSPARIAITASTSEAYTVLFKLLCDAGDEVLIPQPSYPLFEHLAALDLVRAVPYALEYHGCWSLDRDSVDAAWSPRTRAVIVVSPNNPTGSYLREADCAWLLSRAADRRAAVIADEVFGEYPLDPGRDACAGILRAGEPPALVFALDGLSKSCGLPQLKLGWIAFGGPDALVAEAAERLELVLDTYLSVNTPVQVALRDLLSAGATVRDAIRTRVAGNLAAARAEIGYASPCDLLRVEGGWSAVVRVPAVTGEETLALRLLEDDGVLAHPGYFFDFPREAYLVVSLLPEPATFREGIARMVRRAGIA